MCNAICQADHRSPIRDRAIRLQGNQTGAFRWCGKSVDFSYFAAVLPCFRHRGCFFAFRGGAGGIVSGVLASVGGESVGLTALLPYCLSAER